MFDSQEILKKKNEIFYLIIYEEIKEKKLNF